MKIKKGIGPNFLRPTPVVHRINQGLDLKLYHLSLLRKMKKPEKIDTFLYRHFKNNGHSPNNILIHTVLGPIQHVRLLKN